MYLIKHIIVFFDFKIGWLILLLSGISSCINMTKLCNIKIFSKEYKNLFSFDYKLKHTALCICLSLCLWEMLFLKTAINSPTGKRLHQMLNNVAYQQSAPQVALK